MSKNFDAQKEAVNQLAAEGVEDATSFDNLEQKILDAGQAEIHQDEDDTSIPDNAWDDWADDWYESGRDADEIHRQLCDDILNGKIIATKEHIESASDDPEWLRELVEAICLSKVQPTKGPKNEG